LGADTVSFTGKAMSDTAEATDERHVLVIDAHPVSRLIIAEELEPMEATLTFIDKADDGVRHAIDNPPSLILLDLVAAAGRETMEFINELKVAERTRNTPVAIITGMDSREELDRARKAGVAEVFHKPFAVGDLGAWAQRFFNHTASDGRRSSHILLVEDSDTIRAITTYLLEKHGHTVTSATDGIKGLQAITDAPDTFDMIITDINMPNMDGRELVERIRGDNRFQFIPIIVSTTISEKENIKRLLNAGADDYIVKPFSSEEFVARIDSQLRVKNLYGDLKQANLKLAKASETLERRVQERTAELRESNIDAIFSLAMAAEAKDDATGNHVYRIQHFCQALARVMGLSEVMTEDIGYSSIMHDVGKISIPDSILKKPGKLTDKEFDVMKTHASSGERILPSKPFFKTARQIARSHHEKWDGGGYPDRLVGKDIPLPARITAVADVFDALVAKRCYKEAWPIEKAHAEIVRCAGTHFDPDVVVAWEELYQSGQIERILKEWGG
jgi:putative two-component system response regulator